MSAHSIMIPSDSSVLIVTPPLSCLRNHQLNCCSRKQIRKQTHLADGFLPLHPNTRKPVISTSKPQTAINSRNFSRMLEIHSLGKQSVENTARRPMRPLMPGGMLQKHIRGVFQIVSDSVGVRHIMLKCRSRHSGIDTDNCAPHVWRPIQTGCRQGERDRSNISTGF